MADFGDTFEQALLDLIFRNSAAANIGDAAGLQPSAAAGSLEIHLHTADPGEAGTPTTSEATYTGYAAGVVARTTGVWGAVGTAVTNAAQITVGGENTGANETITHVSITNSPPTFILYKSALAASRLVATGSTFQFDAGSLTATHD